MKRLLVGILLYVFVFGLNGGAAAATFSDLDGHWSERAVMLNQSRGIISGYADGSFRPNDPVNRAEFSRMLINALELGRQRSSVERVYSSFNDVPYGHWAKEDIVLAGESGLVKGYGDKLFGPGDVINRQQIAALVVRALRYIGETEFTAGDLAQFSDQQDISGWAREYVALAVGSGFLQGYPDGGFRPTGSTSRAEAAVIISRLLQYSGAAFDYAGELTGVKGRLMYIDNGSETVAFSVYRSARFFADDQAIDYSGLGTRAGQSISVNLGVYGDVMFGTLGGTVQLPKVEVGVRDSWARTVTRHTQQMNGGVSADSATDEAVVMSPQRSLNTSKELMGVSEFTYQTGYDGTDQVIAIVDTGVDVSNGDLALLPDGGGKIVDWVDFTNEGRVELNETTAAGTDLNTAQGTFAISDVPSSSGDLRYGFFDEQGLGFDINFNGSVEDSYLVLATDTARAGVYQTVYVDTDGDGDVNEEQSLTVYRQSNQGSRFVSGQNKHSFPFVISELNSDGSMVKLGFDANGHGTHIAGIAAANGQFKGVAPGAQLLVIKAIGSDGSVDWQKLQEAITYAAVSGADVINLSLGYYQDVTGGNSQLAQTVNDLVNKYDVTFTVASGNKGPGIGTMASPANAAQAISVGAYISSAMWQTDFQWDVKQGGLWYFSSMGPRKDGLLQPTVVAPGSAVSTVPAWAGQDYLLMEGTSMAAPHVAGVAAVLLDAAASEGVTVSPAKLQRALAQGATAVRGLDLAEAGNGLVNINGAWQYLKQAQDAPKLTAVTYSDLFGGGKGLYARDFIPGNIPYQVVNYGQVTRRLNWRSDVEWMQPLLNETTLTPGAHRQVPVRYHLPDAPGFYTGLLIGDDPGTYGEDMRLLSTVVKPYYLTEAEKLSVAGKLSAGQVKRYFVDIPAGTERIDARLEVPMVDGKYQGRARIHMVQPNGAEVVMTDYAGNAPEGYQSQQHITAQVEQPMPGVWEMVVYSSATLSLYGQEFSQYNLEASLTAGRQSEETEETEEVPDVIVGVVPGRAGGQLTGFTGISVLDFDTKAPIDGIIEINGLLYNVFNGRVQVKDDAPVVSVKL